MKFLPDLSYLIFPDSQTYLKIQSSKRAINLNSPTKVRLNKKHKKLKRQRQRKVLVNIWMKVVAKASDELLIYY